jgi:hypothetical protein
LEYRTDDYISFKGNDIKTNDRFYPNTAPFVGVSNLSDISAFVVVLESKCDKSIQTINGFEIEAYDCEELNSDIVSRSLVYKNEIIHIQSIGDNFKPQYDKFFEGVRLKK